MRQRSVGAAPSLKAGETQLSTCLAGRPPQRRAVVVLTGAAENGDRGARALAESLTRMGVEAVYLGREDSARRIADAVVEQRADAVELVLDGAGGVPLLRQLLRELIEVGRRDASIVVHRLG
jgi:methylmalonyl-CoA mutase cobalamin-binding domain/chain